MPANDEAAVLLAPELRGADDPSEDGREQGVFAPGDFERLLVRLYNARFTGLLEVSEEGERARIFFEKGRPCAARASERSADLGRIVVDLGLATEAAVDAAVEEARRSARMLGNELTRSGLLDTVGLEVALREQLVRRAVAVGRSVGRAWVLSASDAVGLPGSSVHPASILFRLGADAPSDGLRGKDGRNVSADAFAAVASAADPSGRLAPAVALVAAGAQLSELRTVGGPDGVRLFAWLLASGDARFVDAPPPPLGPQLVGAALEEKAGELAAQHVGLAGATHYEVLGVSREDDEHAVSAAAERLAASLAPDALPVALDGRSRRRAADVRARVIEAARVLGDPVRRAAYDRRMSEGRHAEPAAPPADASPLVRAERARLRMLEGAYVDVVTLLSPVAAEQAPDPDLLAMLGWARHCADPGGPAVAGPDRRQNAAAGEAEVRRALAIDPHNAESLTYLGHILAARGARDEARAHLRAALALNHAYAPAREALRGLER